MSEGWPTRRKRLAKAATFFAAIVLFLVTFFAVTLYKPGAHTVGDLKRLEKGMTPIQVRAVLGEPDIISRSSSDTSLADELWTYTLLRSHWSVTKEDYQLKFFQGRLDIWWKVK
jgi:hypothetical protein